MKRSFDNILASSQWSPSDMMQFKEAEQGSVQTHNQWIVYPLNVLLLPLKTIRTYQ